MIGVLLFDALKGGERFVMKLVYSRDKDQHVSKDMLGSDMEQTLKELYACVEQCKLIRSNRIQFFAGSSYLQLLAPKLSWPKDAWI